MAASGLSTAGAAGLAVHSPVLNAEPNSGLLVGDGLDDLEERGYHDWSTLRVSKVGKDWMKGRSIFGALVALL